MEKLGKKYKEGTKHRSVKPLLHVWDKYIQLSPSKHHWLWKRRQALSRKNVLTAPNRASKPTSVHGVFLAAINSQDWDGRNPISGNSHPGLWNRGWRELAVCHFVNHPLSLSVPLQMPNRWFQYSGWFGNLNNGEVSSSVDRCCPCAHPPLTDLSACIFPRSVIEQPFLRYRDVKPGSIVKVRCAELCPGFVSTCNAVVIHPALGNGSTLTLSLLRVINVKIPLQPYKKYDITQYGGRDFS